MGIMMVYKPTYNWGAPSCKICKGISQQNMAALYGTFTYLHLLDPEIQQKGYVLRKSVDFPEM